jgi:uncharacterized protein (TIGR02444 family)
MSDWSSAGGLSPALSSAVEKDQSRFWSFSLTVYSKPDVQKECLDLQDRHAIDVNLLLFCAFAGAVHGAVLPDDALKQAAGLVGEWHKKIVTNLREVRRALKPFATDFSSAAPAAVALRNSVKAIELEAERLEQTMLEEWSASRLSAWPRMQAVEATAANIRALLAVGAGSAAEPELPQNLVAAAVAAAR